MDAIQIEECDDVTIEIGIDEIIKEFNAVVVQIKYKEKVIKELLVRGSVECIE